MNSKFNLIKLEGVNHWNNQNTIFLPNEIYDLEEELNIKAEEICLEECEVSLEEIAKLRNSLAGLNDTIIQPIDSTKKTKKRKISVEKKKIESVEELIVILLKIREGHNSAKNYSSPSEIGYSISTSLIRTKSNVEFEIIKDDLFLVILKYLFNELNQDLIELYDIFVDERRKYYDVDHATYIAVINLYIKKKEKLFYDKISDITCKLDISQSILNDTIKYYLNDADQTDENVFRIKISYDKLCEAGVKTY